MMNDIFGGRALGMKPKEVNQEVPNDNLVGEVKKGMGWTGNDSGFFDRPLPGHDFDKEKINGNPFKGFDDNFSNLFKNKKDLFNKGEIKMKSNKLNSKLKKTKNFDNLFKMSKGSKGSKANLLMSKTSSKPMSSKVKEYGFGTGSGKNLNASKKVNEFLSTPNTNKKHNPLVMLGLGKEQAALNNVYNVLGTKTESKARKRIRQQSFLSPMGDFDKDGVANMLDCDPVDPYAQGVINKLGNWAGGKGFRETSDIIREDIKTGSVPGRREANERYAWKKDEPEKYGPARLEVFEEEPNVVQKLYRQFDIGKDEFAPLKKEVIPITKRVAPVVGAVTYVPRKIFGFGATAVGKVTEKIGEEYQKGQEERKLEEEAKRKGRLAGLEYKAEQKAIGTQRQAFTKAGGKTPEGQYESWWRKQYKKDIMGGGRDQSKFGRFQDKYSRGVNLGQQAVRDVFPGQQMPMASLIGMTGSPLGIYQAVGPQQTIPFDVKIDTWFGSGDKLKEMLSTPQPQQRLVAPTQVTPTYTQPTPQYREPQEAQQDDKVYSEKSKRYVKYTRKRYKK